MLVAVTIWYFVIWHFAIIHRVKQHIDTSETGHCLLSKIGRGNLFLPFWCTEVRVTVTSVKWTESGYSPCPVGHPLRRCTPICHLHYGRSTFATPAVLGQRIWRSLFLFAWMPVSPLIQPISALIAVDYVVLLLGHEVYDHNPSQCGGISDSRGTLTCIFCLVVLKSVCYRNLAKLF